MSNQEIFPILFCAHCGSKYCDLQLETDLPIIGRCHMCIETFELHNDLIIEATHVPTIKG